MLKYFYKEVKDMSSNFKVASLFAGIGGICIAFKQAGADIVWANEIDKNACITYRHNFGNSYLCENDIRLVQANQIPKFDILTAGFPCQAFSVAGNRKGLDDERGNLVFEVIRILKEKKPSTFLLENVKNLVTHNKGDTIKLIILELEKLGYYIKYNVLNTMNYGNIPQNRERIYIVGFLYKEHADSFKFPEPIPLTKTIHDIINIKDKKTDRYYYNNSKYYEQLKKTVVSKKTIYQLRRIYVRENKSSVCPTLTANMGMGGHNVPIILDNYDIRKLTPLECLGFQGFPKEFSFPKEVSISSCYKQIGNSVSVIVVRRIAENIINAMNTKSHIC